ncbi:MAG: HEAT repeat protein [Myxococcota bacterium]|jgi:HEAT repeat protein
MRRMTATTPTLSDLLDTAIAHDADGTDWDDRKYSKLRSQLFAQPTGPLFDALTELCGGDDADRRCLGLQLLGQLAGGSEETERLQASLPAVLTAVVDSDPDVATAGIHALAHLSANGVPWDAKVLRKAVGSQDDVLRHAAAAALGSGSICDRDPEAVRLMLFLVVDPDDDVRNWAVFGLGVQSNADSDLIRNALRKAAHDENHEIRGEALTGLAKRADPDALKLISQELSAEEASLLAVEAAEELGHPDLVEPLKALRKEVPDEAEAIDRAIAACGG